MPENLIADTLEKLRAMTRSSIQNNWRSCPENIPREAATKPETWDNWEIATTNHKDHIAWDKGRKVIWLGQNLTVPHHLQKYPLTGLSLQLCLTWWAEAAQIFINGVLVQEGDLFDFNVRVLLSQPVTPGETFAIAVKLISPAHDAGALVKSSLWYETPEYGEIDPGFVADELEVLQILHPQSEEILQNAVKMIDWAVVSDGAAFAETLQSLRQQLQTQINPPPGKIHLLGHSHLDMAWLWPLSETWTAAERTFTSVLQLMQDFPELTFCHTTAALYQWVETHRPELFAAIKQRLNQGKWEIVAPLWIEPELNIIDGESIIRQILYAQRYCQEKFHQLSPVAWVPDSFGFCWQLPQILTQGGIQYFVTQKLRWNDTTKFPHGYFWWQSPDGSRIFSLMSALIGESIEPVKMATNLSQWQAQTNNQDLLWLPGVGDKGGGPTRDMLETARRWQKSPFFPPMQFTTAATYLQQLASSTEPSQIPIWNDELYLEFHRGCYTTHGDQKRYLRRCETLLYQAELYSSLAAIIANQPYPQQEIETAWKQVLFNEFHDILPGSGIPEVYIDANCDWEAAQQAAATISQGAIAAIAAQISLPPPPKPDAKPIIVFNSLNWARSEVVSLTLTTPAIPGNQWQIYDLQGQPVPSQTYGQILRFRATDIPSVGYRLYWLTSQNYDTIVGDNSSDKIESLPQLENEFLRVIIDTETGNISSIFDKVNAKEILSSPGNQLQTFQDSGQYWDAWNIDPNYTDHPLNPPVLKEIQPLETGPVQWRWRIVRQFGSSEFCQDYILAAGSPVLQIASVVDWRERHVLVKAAFPLNVEADFATYEMPCGAISRPTKPQTPAEKAKWEVPAIRWADISDRHGGVSLLNNCKYGYDAQPHQLRLTLLRGATWPDPEADLGKHEFTYAVYPHGGSWQTAGVVHRGLELNVPLDVWQMDKLSQPQSEGKLMLPPEGKLLDLSAENLILMAVKQAEDNPQSWILRCYECHGSGAQLHLQSDLGLGISHRVNLLEEEIGVTDGEISQISPWQIASFRFVVGL